MLDHYHRVADVAQAIERPQQTLDIARVQPDRRFIQHIDGPYQARPDLRGQPDPLRLPAGEGGGAPVEGQVAEPDFEQEGEPVGDLAQSRGGDFTFVGTEPEGVRVGADGREVFGGVGDVQAQYLRQGQPGEPHRRQGRLQAVAAAAVAFPGPHEALQLALSVRILRAFVPARE